MKKLLAVDAFQKTRLKLTLLYILVSFLLLIISSLAAIRAEKNAFSKIENALSDPVQRPRLTALLEKRLGEYEDDFRKRLFSFDLLLLVVASFTSYFLSGRTLKPIQEMIKEQEEFSADVSHELRTPLSIISMEVEALQRTDKKLPLKYQQVFRSIIEEVQRMKKIVDGLLALVRSPQADTLNLLRQLADPIDLNGLIKKCLKQIGRIAYQKDIRVEFYPGKDFLLRADPEKLQQVILILLDNAIKYTAREGRIIIKTAAKGNWCAFSVADSGIGISQQDLPHIFKRFYRSKKLPEAEKGVGLGLAIAKKIIDSMGGHIFANSTPNIGSTFTFQVPYHS